ncbi:AraC family transcriptional regulator [Paenibacillus sp. sptzw28]|uniref:helix-turn-helix domain-containing protein n=1 Tax=Paenibacillus sp. sptzw28 TaxID=715179 RepID=UPI001C6E0D28|nr:helix-turn-helix domain-containing protein [Paenibacillus sp. sptzw28]QYR23069.1 AraC family transcriptional regulator [Paenibacillus sp. sptzw28]
MRVERVGVRLNSLYRRNSLLIKILSSYLVIVIVLLSVFSFVLFRTYSKKSIEQVSQTSVNFISQSYYIADVMLINVYYYFYHLFVNSVDRDLNYGLYDNKSDIFADQDVLKKLKQYVMSNPLIRSIYIYNSKADRVIFSISEVGEGIQPTTDFFDQDIINRLRNTENNISDEYFTRKVDYVIDNKNISENFLTLVFASASNGGELESSLVINLNQRILQQMVTSGRTGDLNQVLIMYKDGNVLSHDDTSMINKNLANESFTKQILQSNNEKGSFITKINDKESLVSYVKARHLGLIFIGIGEHSKLLSSAFSMQKTLLILTIIFILVGIIIAAFFTSSIYNPFRKLLHDIQLRVRNQKKKSSLDVYDYLNHIFNELADDVDKYRLDSSIILNNKKNSFLEKLVDGDIDEKICDKDYMMACGVSFDEPFFLTIVLKMDSFENVRSGIWSKDVRLVRFAILNIASELFSENRFKVEGIDNGQDYVSIILNVSNRNDEILSEIIDNTKEIQDKVDKYLKISVTAGIGDIAERVEAICTSFQNALAASNYRIIFGRKAVIKYSDIAERNNNNDLHDYPYDIEKRIIEAIKELHLRKIDASLNGFFEMLDLYSADKIQITVLQLAVLLTRTLSNIAKTSVENEEYSIKVLVSEIQTCETLEEIKKYLFSLCSEVVEAKGNDSKENVKTMIVNKIKDYVGKHYDDINLSTDTVAEHVRLSRNYVRSIFKEMTGISLSDYITHCRMSEAQRLLIETDYPVRRIAELVGYPENSKHFFTIFKKHYSRTPENYRMSIQNNVSSESE